MNIDVEKVIKSKEKFIERELYFYKYIMENWKENTPVFQCVYINFYMKYWERLMSNDKNRKIYFDVLIDLSQKEEIGEVVEKLRAINGTNEFSYASKLLHTKNPMHPIYDSRICNFLVKEAGVPLKWYKASGKERNIELIKEDWGKLHSWYNEFLKNEGKQWVECFNDKLRDYENISDVKKIDFIIWAKG